MWFIVRSFVLLTFVQFVFCGIEVAQANCVVPNQIANGQTADAAPVMSNFNALTNCINAPAGGPANAIQFNAGSGALGGLPLTNGQLAIGTTNGAPQAATLSAGTGITIANGPGNVTISTTGAGGGGATYELGLFAPPNAASFTFIDAPSSITPTVANVPSAGLAYSVPVTSNSASFPGAYRAVPTTVPWTLTVRAKYGILMSQYPEFGVWTKDTSGKMLGTVIEGGNGTLYLVVKRCVSNTQTDSNPYVAVVQSSPDWFRVTYDGTTMKFYVSWDSQNWLFYYQESSTTFLNGMLQYVGIGGFAGVLDTSFWQPGSTMGALVTYWDINDDPASSRSR